MSKERNATGFTSLAPFKRVYADPSKALVMSKISELVRGGLASWTALANGDIKLRLLTGEIYYLGQYDVIRLDCGFPYLRSIETRQ